MWRFLICLIGLFLVACSVNPQVPISTPTPLPVKPQVPVSTPAQVPNTPTTITVPANTQVPVSISTPTENITEPPVVEPPVVTQQPEALPIVPLTELPPLTEADIQKAESVLKDSYGPACDNLTLICGKTVNGSGVGNAWDESDNYFGFLPKFESTFRAENVRIVTKYQECCGGPVYKVLVKDLGKPTQQILGYMEVR